MKTSLDCLPCFVRQALDAARLVSDDPSLHEKIVRELLERIGWMDMGQSPPALAQRIHRRLRELAGSDDPYAAIKERQNRMALGLVPSLRRDIEKSADSLATAVKLAVAANIIDLGAKTGLTEDEVLATMRNASSAELTGEFPSFRDAVAHAKNILYLTDNAGEIVVDRLLIEQLDPARVTVGVRGAPVINDAVMADARAAGLPDIVAVIENGSDAPGTILADCSEEFRRRFREADLIVAKGQGNFESLSDEPYNVWFLFKVKCPVIAARSGLPVGAHAVMHTAEMVSA
ncbi:MAG TPA: ARMT1-like domain-containing protein [bacterium]|nr:ARMT1-like domain-containing protein [bacterium]